ncbi:MAG: Glycosyl transferase [Candidatus Roizmanbacteria bacterium GW2011_GWC2_41_7]|uniref:Glycosyl transferase n=3 Tax=Candidatus Roizmaniibacteriota TaxID=1752723 RepID=A0A0G0ZLL0_9BACT|nr:MAG: Glycosyl transferase [Candidatus Roizmanbacteria bacterium GW2011_GWC2_41_7]
MMSVEITMPVYNEEAEIQEHIIKLYEYCKTNLKAYKWHITIADNASTDRTPNIGEKLSKKNAEIDLLKLTQKGRGRAVKTAWQNSRADICCYMDIDLSTDLRHLPSLVDAIVAGNDIAIGTRLAKKSIVIDRTLKREIISRSYNLMVKLLFLTKFSDAQCGFKAVSKQVVENLIPHIIDNEWFMDSELLIVGEKLGYAMHEVPVTWHDSPGSTVRVLPTAMGDMHGLLRLFVSRPWTTLPKPHERKTGTGN